MKASVLVQAAATSELGGVVVSAGAGSFAWSSILMSAGWWSGDRYQATATVSRLTNVSLLFGVLASMAWFVAGSIRRPTPADCPPSGSSS